MLSMSGYHENNASGRYNSLEPGKTTSTSLAARKLVSAANSNYSDASQEKSVWLDAWSDPVAGVNAFNSCVHTCDLFGEGEARLVVADEDRKLKVWKGTQKASEHALLDTPVAISSFVSDSDRPRIPSLAVAAASNIYIYRNLRPYYKFAVPPEDVNTEEQEIWTKVMNGDCVIGHCVNVLTQLQEQGVILQTRSLQVMNIADADKKKAFVEHWQGTPLVANTVITCMDTIKLAVDEPDAVSCLVIGTESGRILILNPGGTEVARNIWIGATPALIAVQGELEVGFTITVAARDGKVYTILNGEVSQNIIQLEAAAVGLIRLGKHFLVGCMNDVVHSYQNNGHKNYSIYLPASIHCIAKLEVASARMSRCCLVALSSGEIRIYSDKHLVGMHTVPSPVTAMRFGKYGREDGTLITITKSGALDIKILPRHAVLEAHSKGMGPPPEQEIPLQVPKKTRLYVDQTNRERQLCADMHRMFQRDLAKLRLTTARAYVKILTDGQGAVAFTSSANLSLSLSAQGLGPRFKVLLTVRNDGTTHVRNIPVALTYNERMYRCDQNSLFIPLLVPSIAYNFEISVLCLDPEGGSDTITVVMLSEHSSMPILQAQLRMPVSELEEG